MSQESRKNKATQRMAKEKQKKMNKKLCAIVASIAVVVILAVVIVSCVNKDPVIDEDKYPVATMEIKDYGTVKITLYPNDAPNTVRNFISLANSGYYDGQKILRISDGFCVQFGSPDGTMSGSPGYTIDGEFTGNGFTQNTIKQEEGVISMARTNDPDSAGSQFFFCMGKHLSALEGKYAAFGKVTEGFDIIKKVASAEHDNSVGSGDGVPYDDIIVTSIKVDTKGVNYKAPKVNK